MAYRHRDLKSNLTENVIICDCWTCSEKQDQEILNKMNLEISEINFNATCQTMPVQTSVYNKNQS